MCAESGEGRQSPAFILATRPALLHWINAQELAELRETLAHGNLPADFLWKLKRLAGEQVDAVELQQSSLLASGHPLGWGEIPPNLGSRHEHQNHDAPPLPVPLLHSEWRRGTGRGGVPVNQAGQPVSPQSPFTPGMSHQFIAQNCRLFAALLLATEAGEFRDISPAERDRLLRVLAYVRKEDDALPDYAPEGFTDDQQEVRAVLVELGGLLTAFKSWRLRHQVPEMWG